MPTYFKQGLDVEGNIVLSGDITIGGNQLSGDSDTDSVRFTADIESNLIPDASGTYDLGTTNKRWDTVYASNVNLDGGITVNGQQAVTGTINVSGTISATEFISTANGTPSLSSANDITIDPVGQTNILSDLHVEGQIWSTAADLELRAIDDIVLYPGGNIWIAQNTKLIFEGTIPDNYEIKLQATGVTADRDLILPDEDGTIATREYVSINGGGGASSAGWDFGFVDTNVHESYISYLIEQGSNIDLGTFANPNPLIIEGGEGF